MTEELRQKYQGMERIEIGGKKYLKDPLSSTLLKEELKKSGSFINILANSLMAGNFTTKSGGFLR